MTQIEAMIADIRVTTLLLERKIRAVEDEYEIYMWDEVAAYLKQREGGVNK